MCRRPLLFPSQGISPANQNIPYKHLSEFPLSESGKLRFDW